MVLHTPFVPIATGVLNIKHVLCISTFFLPRLCFNFNFSGWCSWVSFEMAVGFPHCQSIETNFCIIHGGTFSCFSCTKFGDLFVQCLGPYFFTAATHKQKTPTPKQKAKNNVSKPPHTLISTTTKRTLLFHRPRDPVCPIQCCSIVSI